MKETADTDADRRESASGLEMEDEAALGFEHTLMYGRYSKDLGQFAKTESKRLRAVEKQRRDDDKQRRKELLYYRGKWSRRAGRTFGVLWRNTFARLGEDWVFLCVLGVLMALISFVMDYGIAMCNRARIWLYRDLTTHPVLQYISWVTLPIALILFSAGFVQIVSRSAIGSGIPEMKTILRGVPLGEYLTFRTLVAKVVGLTACLGSGMPLGKEGPFVHIASIVATLLTKLITSFKGIYENESRNSEMLAAACAVGVACSFAAPIGGVLFSIEVTSVYFAVRNYWRGFFAAVCGAMVFRLLSVWFQDEETITALFKTDFKVDFPFDPQELFVFALIGVATGLMGALYVWVHRKYVMFMRQNMCMKSFLRQNRFLYPFFVALMVSSVTFPLGVGQFLAADQTTHDQVLDLFSNFTWSSDNLEIDQAEVVAHWTNPYTNFYINLCIYIGVTMCTAVVASTLPVPAGTFIPVFKMGAAFGRLVGECMANLFPRGFRYGHHISPILPGGYAIVGAAALAGSVTNTISTSVIVFELTGQITHILPVMIAVLISNAVSQLLQPSIYDSIIQIKKLPYLPDIVTSTHAYSVYVEDFMVREVKYIWHGITYRQVRDILRENKKLSSVPLVDSPESMVLLGSVRRKQLVVQLETHLGRDRRMEVVARWQRAAQRIQLAKHNHNWKALVQLAKGEQVDAAREERRATLSAQLAPELPDDERERRRIDDEDDVVGVSGARVAHIESAADFGDVSPPAPERLERRPSRFAVTPVPSEEAGGAAAAPAAAPGADRNVRRLPALAAEAHSEEDGLVLAEVGQSAEHCVGWELCHRHRLQRRKVSRAAETRPTTQFTYIGCGPP
ncbi:chloride channel protein 2-like [Amphibalanus amphitrite]|uniref:chloride channel protein 2-like n=1 Tax=Amphibalanus amphitrite TaxID=1232801 RepID=UPI001C90E159|nr:chloride channel protein 2-like [Amphibalanus amphitrite]